MTDALWRTGRPFILVSPAPAPGVELSPGETVSLVWKGQTTLPTVTLVHWFRRVAIQADWTVLIVCSQIN